MLWKDEIYVKSLHFHYNTTTLKKLFKAVYCKLCNAVSHRGNIQSLHFGMTLSGVNLTINHY